MAIAAGTFLAVGEEQEVMAFAGPATRVIDLNRRNPGERLISGKKKWPGVDFSADSPL